jgi:hypothetical protein
MRIQLYGLNKSAESIVCSLEYVRFNCMKGQRAIRPINLFGKHINRECSPLNLFEAKKKKKVIAWTVRAIHKMYLEITVIGWSGIRTLNFSA